MLGELGIIQLCWQLKGSKGRAVCLALGAQLGRLLVRKREQACMHASRQGRPDSSANVQSKFFLRKRNKEEDSSILIVHDHLGRSFIRHCRNASRLSKYRAGPLY